MIPDASLALLLSGVFFAYLWWRIDIDRAEIVLVSGPRAADATWWAYWMLQAVGWAAWLWAWATVILGLLVAGGRPKWLPGSTRTIEKLHRTTSLTVMGLTLLHILLLVYHFTVQDSGVGEHYTLTRALTRSFVPGAWHGGSSGNWGVAVGQIGFYLAIVLGFSYYFRHRIGIRTWRFAHRFSILVYVLATWHTFVYSSNTWYTGYQRTALWVMQLPIAFMVLARLLSPIRRSERLPLKPGELLPRLDAMAVLRLGVRLVAAAAFVVLVGILALDRTGGRPDRPEYPTAEDMEEMDHNAGAATGE